MKQNPHRVSAVATVSLTLLLILGFTVGTRMVAAVDCVGKSYGYPGCPTRPTPGLSTSSGLTSCGNAILDTGEECDKGRFNGKTDCSTDCRLLYCGDGTVSPDINEECEPQTEEVYVQDKSGNLTTEVRFTGTAQCGWYCQPPTCTDAGTCSGGCKLKYIDGCTNTGSTVINATASSTAAVTSNGSSAVSQSLTPPAPTCGNSILEKGEECDDGNRNPIDSCSNECKLPHCGDSVIQKGEQCDDGPKNSDSLANACRTNCLPAHCGDAIIDRGELCDAGLQNSDTVPSVCRTSCMLPRCGDGITDTGEQCDAGPLNSDSVVNACRSTCRLAYCGDGTRDANEDCDDGNRTDTDACTNSCKNATCGDGIMQNGEECDWGTRNSDTQVNACRKLCKLPRCGDGVIDTGEECDGGDCETGPCNADCTCPRAPKCPCGTSCTNADGGPGVCVDSDGDAVCECTSNPDPDCAGQVCGGFIGCNPEATCPTEVTGCVTLAEGGGLCIWNIPCAGLATCTSSAECAPGVCAVGTCCGVNICVPPAGFCPPVGPSGVAKPEAATSGATALQKAN